LLEWEIERIGRIEIDGDPSLAAPHPPAARAPPSPCERGEGWGEGHRNFALTEGGR
jgi:hypothetical protein